MMVKLEEMIKAAEYKIGNNVVCKYQDKTYKGKVYVVSKFSGEVTIKLETYPIPITFKSKSVYADLDTVIKIEDK